MSEHNGIAKEFIEEEIGDCHDNPNLYNEMLAELFNKFALQVATEAVDEEQENVPKKEVWVTCDVADLIHRVSNSVLKNIKKRLNDAD